MKNVKGTEFYDEYGNTHITTKVLGEGGQGIVFRTNDPDIAIKLVTDEDGEPLQNKDIIKKYAERFKNVRLLPIPYQLPISIPVALIKDNAGYVMNLLNDMIPFSNFMLSGEISKTILEDDIPTWLKGMPLDEAKKIVHYYCTGGLRRRLIALYKCASLITRLHSAGLVYGDISPNNIFISDDSDFSAVWLIDADNIRFEVLEKGSVVYTPHFGAPELVQGTDGGSFLTDCHAFAVVAFYLLSLNHPFIGKKVSGEDIDWADSENDNEKPDEKAYAGLFPWIDDMEDDSNSSDSGLPRMLILTDTLKNLFELTFGKGRTNPSARPPIHFWPKALAEAADSTIECTTCHMSYYYDYFDSEKDDFCCPYCGSPRPKMIQFKSYKWYNKETPLQAVEWQFVHELVENKSIKLPQRLFTDFSMENSDETELSVTPQEDVMLIKKNDNSKYDISLAFEGKDFKALDYKNSISTKINSFWLYVKSDSPRLIECAVLGGVTCN